MATKYVKKSRKRTRKSLIRRKNKNRSKSRRNKSFKGG